MNRNLARAFCCFALLLCIRGQGQSISPFILNAAGGSYANPPMYTQFEWSFGELTLIDTYKGSNGYQLTNGVLQPYTDVITQLPDILQFAVSEYRVFPNVTTGMFELDFFLVDPGRMTLLLTDSKGSLIAKRDYRYECCNRIERFDLSPYSDGTYFIHARYTPDRPGQAATTLSTRESSFRVVKLSR